MVNLPTCDLLKKEESEDESRLLVYYFESLLILEQKEDVRMGVNNLIPACQNKRLGKASLEKIRALLSYKEKDYERAAK
jgi:hypothetical protein